MNYTITLEDGTTLYHHGIKNQKWGVRRYQYEDGTLTPEGRKRYLKGEKYREKELKSTEKFYNIQINKASRKYDKTGDESELRKWTLNKQAEMKQLRNMTTDELLSERAQTNMRIANKLLISPAVMTAGLTTIGIGVSTANYAKSERQFKSENRGVDYSKSYQDLKRLGRVDEKVDADITKQLHKYNQIKMDLGKQVLSDKVSKEEESEFWKDLARQYQEQERKKNK